MTDDRELRDGDTGTVASADSDTTLTTVFEKADSWGLFDATFIVVDYATGATANTVLELHDADTSAAAGDLDADTLRLPVQLAPGERVVIAGATLRHFEQDVIADPDGSQDGAIEVTVGGNYVFSR